MSGARLFPALDITWPVMPEAAALERVLAEIDDASPAAAEDLPAGIRLYFTSERDRDRARLLVAETAAGAALTSLAVSDESWAERSQAALTPITVGRITVAPPWTIGPDGRARHAGRAEDGRAGPAAITIAIQPSMGFGTGHHQSTRLCLGLLQQRDVTGLAVLDVGTGSGVLALAAWRLGASPVVAIDYDPDAVTSARENLERNGAVADISVDVADITRIAAGLAGRFNLLLANLTGGVLMRFAPQLVACVADGGRLIISGFQTHEVDDIIGALRLAGAHAEAPVSEDSWVAIALRRSVSSSPNLPTTR